MKTPNLGVPSNPQQLRPCNFDCGVLFAANLILWCIRGDDAAEGAQDDGLNDLFRARLDQIIKWKHKLVLLSGKIDWDWIDGEIASLCSKNGRPGTETRFMIRLLLLSTLMDRPMKGCASAGSTPAISSTSPAKSSPRMLSHTSART